HQQNILSDLRTLLAGQGIHIGPDPHGNGATEAWLEQYFLDHIFPVITPQAIDPAHPFPFVANMGVGALFNLTRLADESRLVEMVLIPNAIPRFVRVPGGETTYVPVERLVCRFAPLLFPGFRIEGSGAFRVLRDSDIELEEEAEDLVRYFRTAIQRRRRGKVILLELDEHFDPVAERLLREKLGLEQAMVTKTSG